MINLYILATLTSMWLYTVESSSKLVMPDLWSAADNEFLKDELLLSWNAANKSAHKEVIALIGLTLSTSVKSSTILPSLPDSKTGFFAARNAIWRYNILIFFLGESELPSLVSASFMTNFCFNRKPIVVKLAPRKTVACGTRIYATLAHRHVSGIYQSSEVVNSR